MSNPLGNYVCICGHHKSNHMDETTTYGLCWPCQGDWQHGRPMLVDSVAHKFKLDNLKYLEQLNEEHQS